MMPRSMPGQIPATLATSAIAGAAGIAIVFALGSTGIAGAAGMYLISISTMEICRFLFMFRSFQEATASVALVMKFRQDSAGLDGLDDDELKEKLCKARSDCGGCQKCWSRPRLLIIASGLTLGCVTAAIGLTNVQYISIIELAFAVAIAGFAIAIFEIAMMKKEADRTGACARALTISRRAIEVLESINRDA